MPHRIALVPCLLLATLALPAAEDTAPSDSALLDRLGDAPLVLEIEGAARWGDQRHNYPISEADDDGNAVVTTDIGPVRIDADLLAGDDPETPERFAGLIQQAAAAGIDAAAENLRFGDSLLVGHRLRGDSAVVIAAGVMHKDPEATADHAATLQQVGERLAAVIAAVEASDMDRLAKRAAIHVLERSAEKPGGDYEGDEITPSFARRVIRHEWIDRVLPDHPAAAAYAEILDAATDLGPAVAYRGEGLRLDRLTNAFGEGGWYLSTPELARIAVEPAIPMYHWPAQRSLRNAVLVLDLPAGTGPEPGSFEALRAARLYHGDDMLAWWSQEQGFAADQEAWREVLPARRGLSQEIAAGYLPPHLVVRDLNGDIHQILTTHGTVEPPADRSAEAGEVFLDRASEVLPDAPHLDLIGQYLFQYTYDSPDPAEPLLLGTREISGDIHQTALQTLSTVTGGQCRGDCDDLSELYQQILERQGRTAHVISLPAHAAVSWAEERDDGWHVFVMQTGPTLEFTAPKLQDALAQAYKRFDAADTFDPNGLGLLLRFSGENTRSGWRLSYRIFSEPEYARTMIDVQRDWHFQTYLQGIKKMQRLIASGDEDTANYRELAGLSSFTGQHAQAADYLEQAIERTPEADSRLFQSSELAHHYLEADMGAEAEATVADILDNQLPALREQLGPAVVQFGLQLAGYLVEGERPLLALRVLEETATEQVADTQEALKRWIAERFDQDAWDNHPQLAQMKRLMSWYAGTGSNALLMIEDRDRMIVDQRAQRVVRTVQDWCDHFALRDADDPGKIPMRYADVGRFYEGVIGPERLIEQLLAAEAPPAGGITHHQRVGGLAQLAIDLPWIKISPPYWSQRLTWLVSHREEIDPAQAELIAEQLYAAIDATEARELTGALLDRLNHNGLVLAAILTEDAKRLRKLMVHVREKDDKRLRDATARAMGDTAPFVSQAWFSEMLEIWAEELDYKPKYYWIAWRAALSGAPERALQVAELAAERFSDDPTFVEEYEFMQELFAAEPATP